MLCKWFKTNMGEVWGHSEDRTQQASGLIYSVHCGSRSRRLRPYLDVSLYTSGVICVSLTFESWMWLRTLKVYGNACVYPFVLCCEHSQHISWGNGAGEDVPSGFTEQTSLHINAARRKKDEALNGRETAQRTKVDEEQWREETSSHQHRTKKWKWSLRENQQKQNTKEEKNSACARRSNNEETYEG